MRKATLYQLGQSEHVVLGDVMRIAEYVRSDMSRMAYLSGDRAIAFDKTVKQIDLRVHCYRRASGEDVLLAVNRDLQELIEEAVYRGLLDRVRTAEAARGRAEYHHKFLTDSLAEFSRKPWYRRVWAALKGNFYA